EILLALPRRTRFLIPVKDGRIHKFLPNLHFILRSCGCPINGDNFYNHGSSVRRNVGNLWNNAWRGDKEQILFRYPS
ncbi:MAG: hypothetical protein WBL68_09845, partial [Nitrososphaeraceae archaeon]